jgi:hypothetical protein
MIKALLELVGRFGSPLLLALIAVVLAIACGVFFWLFLSAVHAWATEISDPTERGLAYVAIAIVAHAMLASSGPSRQEKSTQG